MRWFEKETKGDLEAAQELAVKQLEDDYRDICSEAKPISVKSG